ncbi:ABC transporter permease [Marinitoga lauensis]|uniref:ABC transporter permease n=1 Tax=Marinitoga lauensis TaxID=2201189 RepID=UPI0010124EA7|nr:ABC transporter permease [Marinitoga lauensis]
MSKIIWLSKYITKESMRNKSELFFTLFFPLIFLIMFGFIFNNQNSDSLMSIAIYTDNERVIDELSKTYNAVKISNIDSVSENIKKGNYDAGIVVKNNSVKIYYDETNMNNALLIQGLELTLKKILLNRNKNFEYIK